MTGEELKKMREKAEMTQQEIAVHLGVSLSAYCNWETGRNKIFGLTALGIYEKMKPFISEEAA